MNSIQLAARQRTIIRALDAIRSTLAFLTDAGRTDVERMTNVLYMDAFTHGLLSASQPERRVNPSPPGELVDALNDRRTNLESFLRLADNVPPQLASTADGTGILSDYVAAKMRAMKEAEAMLAMLRKCAAYFDRKADDNEESRYWIDVTECIAAAEGRKGYAVRLEIQRAEGGGK